MLVHNTPHDASAQYTTLPQPARVVLDVMEPYLDKGHRVFADRYYTSILLATALHDRQTDYTGTSMKNRLDLPDQIRDKSFHLTDNQVVAYRSDWLLAMGWRAAQKKKPLIMISSNSPSTSLEVQSRRTGRLCIKPQVVNEYNQSMNGVDKAEQYTVYYSIQKSKKWWRKLFFWLLEVTIVNSYILYKISTPSPSTHLQYRRSITNALATRYLSLAPPRPLAGRPSTRHRPDPSRFNHRQQHYLGRREESLRCAVCSLRHRTIYYCKNCPSKPALCPVPCFKQYHKAI